MIITEYIMKIHEYYYNDNNRRMYVEFSTKQDGDKFYRTIDLGFEDVELYSPEVITEEDMLDIDEDFVIDNNQVITTHYHFPVEYLFKLCMDNNCIDDKGNLTNVEL